MFALTCVTTLTVGCTEQTTTKKPEVKVEKTEKEKKEATIKNGKDSEEEIKVKAYYSAPATTTPTPTPAPAPAPTPAPIPTYVPLPAGWNNYKSVCSPNTIITPEQKAQIDALAETWVKISADNPSPSDCNTLRGDILQYLWDNGYTNEYEFKSNVNIYFHDVSVVSAMPIYMTNIENKVLTSTPYHYRFMAVHSTGRKAADEDSTICSAYEIVIID